MANAIENEASGIIATCQKCFHEATLPIGGFPLDAYVPDLSLRMRCSACGSKGVRTIPSWVGKRTGPRP